MGFVRGAVNEEAIALLPNPLRLDSESTNVISERGFFLYTLFLFIFRNINIYTDTAREKDKQLNRSKNN